MWLVRRSGDGLDPGRETVPTDTVAALVRWYTGIGGRADEALGVQLVQRAKTFDRWLACDCLAEGSKPPLLSPAYLTEAETYYLRRLTGAGRPEHLPNCPFHRDQVLRKSTTDAADAVTVERPEGDFAILKPIKAHLAQRPDDADGRQDAGRGPPRLARLLWLLLDRAELATLAAVGNRPDVSIAAEFARLRDAAKGLEIAPGVPLGTLLFTHPAAFGGGRVGRAIENAADSFPAGHTPQAFALLYSRSVRGREVTTSSGEPIIIATDVGKPRGFSPDDGPFLVLAVVGEHAASRRRIAVSAYAQPVQDGRRFWPVEKPSERCLIDTLMRVQGWLHRERDVALIARKALFDGGPGGSRSRGDITLDLIDKRMDCIVQARLGIDGASASNDAGSERIVVSEPVLADPSESFRAMASGIMSLIDRLRSIGRTGSASRTPSLHDGSAAAPH